LLSTHSHPSLYQIFRLGPLIISPRRQPKNPHILHWCFFLDRRPPYFGSPLSVFTTRSYTRITHARSSSQQDSAAKSRQAPTFSAVSKSSKQEVGAKERTQTRIPQYNQKQSILSAPFSFRSQSTCYTRESSFTSTFKTIQNSKAQIKFNSCRVEPQTEARKLSKANNAVISPSLQVEPTQVKLKSFGLTSLAFLSKRGLIPTNQIK